METYARSRILYDADSHLMETFEWLRSYADRDLRDLLPELALGGAGAQAREAIGKAQARISDPEKTAALKANVIGGPKGWYAFGAFDPAERREALDRLGFKRQLVFSTFAGSQFLRSDEPRIKYGGARAHNRGMADFCRGDERLMPVAIVPLDDGARALAEAKTAVAEGCRAIWVAAAPTGETSPGHPDMDPFWAFLEEARVPFVLHIGQGTRVLPKAYENNGRPRPQDWLGGGENLRVLDYMVIPYASEMFLSTLVFHGVFERFPGLKGGVIELGAGWVPEFLRRLDLAQRMFGKSDPQVAGLKLKPSDYIRRQVRFTPFAGEDVGRIMRDAGEELFLFSSDYPHPEGGRDPVAKFEATMEGISEAARTRFYASNFAEMMGLSA